MSVSGHEIPLQKKVIAEMAPVCDEIRTDYTGKVKLGGGPVLCLSSIVNTKANELLARFLCTISGDTDLDPFH